MGILRVNQVSGDETQLSTLGIGTTTPVTGSVFFDGNGDYLEVPPTNNSDWAFDGAFTIEHWTYWNVVADGQLLSPGTGAIANAWYWQYYSNQLQIGRQAVASDLTANFTPSPNKWYHIAISRDSSNLTKIFVDGNQIGSGTVTSKYAIPSSNLLIGYGGAGYFNGYLSNVRVLKGTALYTANFTPPTLILEPIQDTVLLCCNNQDSAAAVSLAGIGTSKTITVNGNAVASTFNPGLVRNFTSGTQFSGVTKIDTQGYFVPPSGTAENRFPNFGSVEGARGVYGGGYNPGAPVSVANLLEYLTISTTGNTLDFGDLSIAPIFGNSAACSSSSRGLFMAGEPNTTQISYVTISTTGNSSTFGQLTVARRALGGCSNATRGLAVNGWASGRSNIIDYVTIATEGNALDFGDTVEVSYGTHCCGSPTRGVFTGGTTPTPANLNTIQYVTFASLGNTSDFGDLTSIRFNHGCSSNITRGVMGGGQTPGATNTIDYITIATLGNAVSFGNLTVARITSPSVASSVRSVFAGGTGTPSFTNTIDYITLATVGNATDFGDLIVGRSNFAGCSNGHGGLG